MLVRALLARQMDRETKKERKEFYFSPSQLGKCRRRLWFEAKGEKGDIQLIKEEFLEDGHEHEKITIERLKEAGIDISHCQEPVDIPLVKGINIENIPSFCSVCKRSIPKGVLHGHIDGLIGGKILFEHKAYASERFREVVNERKLPRSVYVQVALYLRGLSYKGIKKARVLVKDRNTSKYVEFLMEYDRIRDRLIVKEFIDDAGIREELGEVYRGIVKRALREASEVEEYLKRDEVPPVQGREFDTEECGRCPYRVRCFRLEREHIKEGEVLSWESGKLSKNEREILKKFLEVKIKRDRITEEYNTLRDVLLKVFSQKDIKGVEIPSLGIGVERGVIERTNKEVDYKKFAQAYPEIYKEVVKEVPSVYEYIREKKKKGLSVSLEKIQKLPVDVKKGEEKDIQQKTQQQREDRNIEEVSDGKVEQEVERIGRVKIKTRRVKR